MVIMLWLIGVDVVYLAGFTLFNESAGVSSTLIPHRSTKISKMTQNFKKLISFHYKWGKNARKESLTVAATVSQASLANSAFVGPYDQDTVYCTV